MFLTALNLSHDFLSAIFGILRKFRIDIGIFFSKHIFFEMKKNREKKCFEKKWDFFCKNRFWDFFQLKSHLKSVFFKKISFFLKNIFSRDFFSFQKNRFFEKPIPISIRNFIRNPKIILRKSCDKFKFVKNKESGFFYKFYQILVMC